MADGVLLLVDAFEGPMPQTRFVLQKAIELGLKPIVVINKVDKLNCTPEEVNDAVFDLMFNLDATEEQLDFPTLYGSAKNGWMGPDWKKQTENIFPLLDAIIEHIPAPNIADGNLQMLITSLDYSNYTGRIAIGRLQRGQLKTGQQIAIVKKDGTIQKHRLKGLFVFEGFSKKETDQVQAGDICALQGLEGFEIGDTVADPENPEALPTISIDEPTMSMVFTINDSPFFGKEGKFVTSRHIKERLEKELEKNLALRVEDTGSADTFRVFGRGVLHLSVLIETMRREGYEFAVSKPEVLFKRDEHGALLEPIEHVIVDVPDTHVGTVIEILGRRKGEMVNMMPTADVIRAEFYVPARGLIGFRTEFLTSTRGAGIIHHTFHNYQPHKGQLTGRVKGALVSMESGASTAYALEMIQERGTLFVAPGVEIYEGMVVGENSREDDLSVNPCRAKHLTNMRASGSDGIVKLDTPRDMSLEQFIEFIEDDELLEVTPVNLRIRKKILDTTSRQRAAKRSKQQAES